MSERLNLDQNLGVVAQAAGGYVVRMSVLPERGQDDPRPDIAERLRQVSAGHPALAAGCD